jgi:hypothetical protein
MRPSHSEGECDMAAWAPQRLAAGKSPAITPAGLAAAQRLRRDWELRSSENPRLADLARQAVSKAGSRFTSRTWSLLVWVVCQDTPDGARVTVEAWAEKHANSNTKYAVGLLGGALDALAAYYGLGEPMPDILSPIGRASAQRPTTPA